ncbi:MAG: hypothetical protein ABI435_08245 [Pseudolysinimonas sp.]
MTRIHSALLVSATLVVALLAGCQGASAPSPTDSPSGGGLPGGSTDAVQGATKISPLGDPCALLTSDEITTATGVAVLGVVRGEVKADGTQLCAWAMDAEGSASAALAGFSGSDLGPLISGLSSAGGAVGVQVRPTDPDMTGSQGSDGGGTSPNVTVVALPLGLGGAAVATPNGGAAFAANATTTITVMKLIAGPATTTEMTDLITLAFGRLP